MNLTAKQLVAEAKKNINEADVHAVYDMIKDPNTLIIDVREPSEFAEGHIAGSTNVPRGLLEFKLDPDSSNDFAELQDKKKKMIVYCRSGSRSALAVQSIKQLGYWNAYSMIGGMLQWKESDLPWTK